MLISHIIPLKGVFTVYFYFNALFSSNFPHFFIISCSFCRFPSEIHGLAIDSAFASMYDAALEIADKKVNIPTIFIKGMLEYVRR